MVISMADMKIHAWSCTLSLGVGMGLIMGMGTTGAIAQNTLLPLDLELTERSGLFSSVPIEIAQRLCYDGNTAQCDVVQLAIAHSQANPDPSESLNSLINLLTELEIDDDLQGFGRFTVFAPSDDAFEEFLSRYPQFLELDSEEEREQLAEIINYHVVVTGEPITTETFESVLFGTSASMPTLHQQSLELRLQRGDRISVTYATPTGSQTLETTHVDLEATNGVIHLVDQVMIPIDVLSGL